MIGVYVDIIAAHDAFEQFAFVEHRAGADQCDQVRGVDRAPAGLCGINKLVGSAGLAVMATVLLSIFAHGLTAQPGTNLYARRIAALDETSPEHQKLGDGSPEPAQMPHFGI